MRTLDGDTVVTLKEASERFYVPVSWIRKQLGKPRLPGGRIVRVIKFAADKNIYVFLSEMEELAKPRVFSTDYIEESRRKYDENPEYEIEESVPDYAHDDEETE